MGPNEGATHAFPAAETRFPCNVFDRKPALFEHQPRRFQPQRLDSLGRRCAGFGSEDARELPRAEASRTRKILDIERPSKVAFGIGQGRLNPVGLGIKIQQRGMLRLPTCPSMMHHHSTGIQHDGGYAEVLIARATGLMSIPDDLSAVAAAPLLCAGITTFSALRNSPAKAGDLVGVLGIGGLGHLGVQYARHMGFEVAAIGRGADKSELAKKLGAHHYIDSSSVDPGQALQNLGGAALVIATASGGKAVAQLVKGLPHAAGS
jgi:hypothetical protein